MPNKITITIITLASIFYCACKAQSTLPVQESLPRIENVHFTKQADTIKINYDLLANSPEIQFDIRLMLTLDNNKMYEIDSTYCTGDIGKGVLPGKEKEISWEILKAFPQGIKEDQIQFIVSARKINPGNEKKWTYITSSGVLIAAGTILIYKL